MVKIMEHPIKMDDLGGLPYIFGNIHIILANISAISIWSGHIDLQCNAASQVMA